MPLTLSMQSLSLSSPSFHGASLRPKPTLPNTPPPSLRPPIRALKILQGRVVCCASDKTVAVEVVRLAPHPKYKRRVRKKKTFQAHDPLNQFKIGDVVQLQKSRPISKTKAFVAIPAPPRNVRKPVEAVPSELGLPLESQQV